MHHSFLSLWDFRTILIWVFTTIHIHNNFHQSVPQVQCISTQDPGHPCEKNNVKTQGSNVKRSPMATWQDPDKWENYNSLRGSKKNQGQFRSWVSRVGNKKILLLIIVIVIRLKDLCFFIYWYCSLHKSMVNSWHFWDANLLILVDHLVYKWGGPAWSTTCVAYSPQVKYQLLCMMIGKKLA